ncbi:MULTISPECIES: zf-HC2 domain-containing protein [Corynebacterium]|uniref:zf-HC2 domain-containing protein n=1 Tax=Corynebacterium TaxID=1716 RepID=UPI001EF21680|nr:MULTISPECIES: zf-HC2 domain-containing protein [Corynebacterium]MCG7465181.1 zf-HC2 domain-containing protein [Corynebacterium sp. ACRPJ]MDV2430962.1 zf-HC2 domain-containing protein [Corynebacterium tuberculostearicum]MDV2434370.1 zf-HC2 domain-containing protein [Corynebacterium tuberculostearicum]WKE53550.1 zf-HC2 domain-containing protein [Corynebacterium tuberculostearicum]WKE55730.1 zf-HC2 domain-containing protein [Corynebacterium tuberculostearicum]
MLTHSQVQAAISAHMDGEHSDLSQDVIDTHLESCAECRAFRDKAAALSRSLSFVEPADSGMAPPTDLSDVILAGVEPEWRRTASARQANLTVARAAMVLMGAIFAIWAVVLIVHASGLVPLGAEGKVLDPTADPERANLLMEGAAVRFGMACGLFFSAWRPAAVTGLLPVSATMFAFLFGFGMRDIALGTVTIEQVYFLIATALATLSLAWAWAAEKGYLVRAWWKSLNAQPQ